LLYIWQIGDCVSLSTRCDDAADYAIAIAAAETTTFCGQQLNAGCILAPILGRAASAGHRARLFTQYCMHYPPASSAD